MRLMVNLVMLGRAKVLSEALHAPTVTGVHFIRAKFRQKFRRLSVPPKSVVKLVESTRRTTLRADSRNRPNDSGPVHTDR
jgi:hypothetical protein